MAARCRGQPTGQTALGGRMVVSLGARPAWGLHQGPVTAAKRLCCAVACHSGTHMCMGGGAACMCGCFVGVKVQGPLDDPHE